MKPVVTLTTDFGYRDPYVGVMKGVILSRCPECTIVDLTHGIAPHSVLEANFTLRGSYRFFPANTLHVCVVDPGVGGDRRILYLEAKGFRFLAPDNGVLSGLLDPTSVPRQVENESYFLQEVSSTFHGRDIFSPVAASLLMGTDPAALGPELRDPVTIEWSEPGIGRESIDGSILYIDVFGNLVTNITAEHIKQLDSKNYRVFLCGREVGPPLPSYSIRSKGEPLAILGSFGHLEIAVREGNAAEYYGVGTGDEVIVTG